MSIDRVRVILDWEKKVMRKKRDFTAKIGGH
jgi:hypothetical protein